MPRLVLYMEHAGKELLSWPQATVTGSGIGTWHNLGQWDCTLNFPEICKERYHLSSEKLPDSFLTSTLQMRTRKLTAWSSDSNGAYSQERQRRTELKRNKIPDDWSAESHQTWASEPQSSTEMKDLNQTMAKERQSYLIRGTQGSQVGLTSKSNENNPHCIYYALG